MVVPHSLYHEAGTVTIDETSCRHCGQCAAICPADVLHSVDGRIRIRDDSAFGCIACGHCMMVCPEGSVSVTGRGLSPDDLVPLPSRAEVASAEALRALMQSRRSVRHFKDQDIDLQLLERVVEAAAMGPMGIPPWDVGCVIVAGREQVRQLSAEIVRGYEQFLKILRPWVLTLMKPFTRKRTYEQFRHFILPLARTYVDAHRNGKDHLFWNAPAVLIFHHSEYAEAADAAIACTYAMLAAESLGLGNTIIGGAPPILQRNRALCRRLGIPEGHTPSFSLIAGYPATHFRRAVRRHFLHVGNANDSFLTS
jgi:nitroreductase/NAD-dependent dihydropyrimidine dehydrogenase PreA subunit